MSGWRSRGRKPGQAALLASAGHRQREERARCAALRDLDRAPVLDGEHAPVGKRGSGEHPCALAAGDQACVECGGMGGGQRHTGSTDDECGNAAAQA